MSVYVELSRILESLGWLVSRFFLDLTVGKYQTP